MNEQPPADNSESLPEASLISQAAAPVLRPPVWDQGSSNCSWGPTWSAEALAWLDRNRPVITPRRHIPLRHFLPPEFLAEVTVLCDERALRDHILPPPDVIPQEVLDLREIDDVS